MTSLRLPPIFIPGTPSSQPPITCDCPIWNVKLVRPALRLESNDWPLVSQPVYWTSAFSPATAAAPVPAFRSMTLRPSGYCTHAGVAVAEHELMPPPALKSSVPGDGDTAEDGPGLSLATGPVFAYGSEYPQAAAPSAVSRTAARRTDLTRR